MTDPLLSIRDLRVDYLSPEGPVRALDRVSLEVGAGEIVGVAGESGCGKSTLAQAVLRILPPPAVIRGGSIRLEGQEILELDEAGLRRLRWRRVAMVFQGAMDALNPVLTVSEQIADTLRAHGAASSPAAARERVAALLRLVGIDPGRGESYPHQLSGGMRQRVGIAIALALDPALLILDEPTTALDVIVEREILDEIRALQRSRGFSVLFITHDLTRMMQFSDRVAVFYAARLVEVAPAAGLRDQARHPYTRALLRAFPSVEEEAGEPSSIPGVPPSLRHPPRGCRFHPRCELAVAACREAEPGLVTLGPGHAVACHLVTG